MMEAAALAQRPPQCRQAQCHHQGSSVQSRPTTDLSLFPQPSPGSSSARLACPPWAGNGRLPLYPEASSTSWDAELPWASREIAAS